MAAVRTFIAIQLGSDVQQLLGRIQKMLASQIDEKDVRWVDKSNVHLTLKFLGDVQSGRLPEVYQGVQAACAEIAPFAITVRDLGCFPNLQRPRVIWAGVTESMGMLQQLQQAIEEKLAQQGYERERREFTPHLTLGRVNRGIHRDGQQRIGRIVQEGVQFPPLDMPVSAVSVMRSDLQPSGAVYSELHRTSL